MTSSQPFLVESVKGPGSPKVLLWTDSDQFAGTERHLAELEKGLRRLAISVAVACPPDSPLEKRVLENGGTVRALPSKGASSLSAVLRMRRWIEAGDVDILHVHNGRTALLGAIASERIPRGVLMASQHFIHPARTARRGLQKTLSVRLHGWVNSRVAAWVCVSEAVRRALEQRGEVQGAPVFKVLHGLDERIPEIGASVPDFDRRVLNLVCVARLAPEKGHLTLLDAMAHLSYRGIPMALHLVGEGPLRGVLEQRVRELGLEAKVLFWGYQTRADSWICACDALVLPSPEEPFGLVLLEAMRASKPVIAARAGGANEIVSEERSGLLFSPEDAVDLSRQIERIAGDAELRERFGRAGYWRWRTDFSLNAMCSRMESLYGWVWSRRLGRRGLK